MSSKRNGHRRSRSVLFWAMVTFALGQFLIGILLHHVSPLVRFPSAAQVLSSLDRQPISPRLIIFGSSRTGCGIHASEINALLAQASSRTAACRVFNASVPAGDMLTTEFLYDLVQKRGYLPDWLIVEISPETLNSPNPWMAGHVIRQLTWAHLPTHLGDAIRTNSGPRYLGALLLPALVHRTAICEALCQTIWDHPDEPAGVAKESFASRGPLDWGKLLRLPAGARTLPAARLAAVRSVGDVPRWLRNYRIAGLSPAALERLLRRCRDEGVGVVLLAPPVSSAHRAQYTPAIESAFQGYLKGICQEFGCAFIDARNWVPDELFVDCHHLDSETGSPYFTRLLTHRVLVPLLDRPGTTPTQPRLILRAVFPKDCLQ